MSASPDLWPQLPPSRLPSTSAAVPVVRRVSGEGPLAADRLVETDGELLRLFTRHSDAAAFDRLVQRHTPMVWRVCRQTLRRQQDAEDAFQATFLLLVKSARQIGASESAAGWLFRVAYRTSLRARKRLASRREEALALDPTAPSEIPFPDLTARQHMGVLAEELMELPLRYQTPLVMRYIEGQSRRAIAEATDVTVATVQGRLARGKQLLRRRLVRRGVSLSVAVGVLSSNPRAEATAASTHLLLQTTTSALSLATGGTLAASTAVVLLLEQGTRAMLFASLTKPMAAAAACGLAALVLAAPPVESTATTTSEGVVLTAAVEGEEADATTATLQLAANEPTSDREPEASAPGAEAGKNSVVVREVYLFENLVNALKESNANKSDRACLESLAEEISHAVGIKLDSIDIFDSNKSLVISADQPTHKRLAEYLAKVRAEENVAKFVAQVLSEDTFKPSDGEPGALAHGAEAQQLSESITASFYVNDLMEGDRNRDDATLSEIANEITRTHGIEPAGIQVHNDDQAISVVATKQQIAAVTDHIDALVLAKKSAAVARARSRLDALAERIRSKLTSVASDDPNGETKNLQAALEIALNAKTELEAKVQSESHNLKPLYDIALSARTQVQSELPKDEESREDDSSQEGLYPILQEFFADYTGGKPLEVRSDVVAAEDPSSATGVATASEPPQVTATLQATSESPAVTATLQQGDPSLDLRFGDMALNGRKLSDTEQNELLRKQWAEAAKKDPPPVDGEPSFKELHTWHTYWEHQYDALQNQLRAMTAANERTPGAVPEKEVQTVGADIFKARAEALRYERELKLRALKDGEPGELATGGEAAASNQSQQPSGEAYFNAPPLFAPRTSRPSPDPLLEWKILTANALMNPSGYGLSSKDAVWFMDEVMPNREESLRATIKINPYADATEIWEAWVDRQPDDKEREVRVIAAMIRNREVGGGTAGSSSSGARIRASALLDEPAVPPTPKAKLSAKGDRLIIESEQPNGTLRLTGRELTLSGEQGASATGVVAEKIATTSGNESTPTSEAPTVAPSQEPTVEELLDQARVQVRKLAVVAKEAAKVSEQASQQGSAVRGPMAVGVFQKAGEQIQQNASRAIQRASEILEAEMEQELAQIESDGVEDASAFAQRLAEIQADFGARTSELARLNSLRSLVGGSITMPSIQSSQFPDFDIARFNPETLTTDPPVALSRTTKARTLAPQRVQAFEAVRVPSSSVEAPGSHSLHAELVPSTDAEAAQQAAQAAAGVKEQLAAIEQSASVVREWAQGDDQSRQMISQLENAVSQMKGQLKEMQVQETRAKDVLREVPVPLPAKIEFRTSELAPAVQELESLRQQNEMLRAELDAMRQQIEKSSFAFADSRVQWQGPNGATPAQPFVALLPLDKSGRPGKYAGANQQYGFSVQQLQQRLNEVLNPSPKLDIDGDYGPQTVAAVKRLQTDRGLRPSGVADEPTRRAMGLLEVTPAPQATTIESDPWNRNDVTIPRNGLKPIRTVLEATVAPAAPPISAVPSLPAAPASPVTKPTPIPTPTNAPPVPNAPPVTPPTAEVEESGDAQDYFKGPPLFTPRTTGIALLPPKPDGARIKYAKRNSEYGWSVLQLQQRLNQVLKQSTPLRVDGDYGPLTEAAVKEFQKLRELPVTGDVDERTREALGFVEPEGTFEPADRVEAYRTQINKNLDEAENSLRQLINIAKHANDIRKMHAPKPPKHGEVVPSALMKAAIGQRDFIFSKTDAANSMVNEVSYGASFRDNPDAITVESKLTKEAADFVPHLERLELINHYTNAAYQSLFDAALAKDKYSFDIEEFDPEKLVDWASSRVRREGAKENVVSIGEKK